MKSPVCTFGATFTREHACWILAFALEGIDARRIRKFSRYVFLKRPVEQIAPRLIARQRHFWYRCVRQRFAVCFNGNLLVADLKPEQWLAIHIQFLVPIFDDLEILWV